MTDTPEKMKMDFTWYTKTNTYKSCLAEGAKHPLDLNRELMEKFRNAMYGIEEGKYSGVLPLVLLV